MAKALTFEVTEGGCIVTTSHKLNKDGYFRKMVSSSKWMMYHRYVWEREKGPIPNGYEIDHLCNNRACCNIEHLQCITALEHRIKTNKCRYAPRRKAMLDYYNEHKCTGTELARVFGVETGTACALIRTTIEQTIRS